MHNRRMADQQNTLGDSPALGEPAETDQPEQIAALAADLLGHMRAALDRAAEDPFSNPVMTMALAISRRIDQGTLTDADLSGLVCWLRDEAYQARAERIADYVGLTGGAAPEAAMAELARGLVRPDPNDSAIPFAQFRRAVERTRFSAVFTAHPTFSLPYAVGDALARAASGEQGTACFTSHRPVPVTLEDEFDQAHAAIARGRDAIDLLTGAILDAARETWAGRWLDLAPRPVTLTTWVGYDTDGRTDIGWWDTLRLRLRMKLYQLERVAAQLRPLAVAEPRSSPASRPPSRRCGTRSPPPPTGRMPRPSAFLLRRWSAGGTRRSSRRSRFWRCFPRPLPGRRPTPSAAPCWW